MKIASIVCVVLLLVLSSCSNSSPDHVAAEFSVALNALDFQKARTLSTKKTHKLINLIENAASLSKEDPEPDKGRPNCTCKEEGEKATCNCCYPKKDGESEDCLPVTVVKEDGAWLVDLSKESLMNGINGAN